MKMTLSTPYQTPVCSGYTNGTLSKRFFCKPNFYKGLLRAEQLCHNVVLFGSCVTDAATWAAEATCGVQKAAIALYAALATLNQPNKNIQKHHVRRWWHAYRRAKYTKAVKIRL
jgi:hypothetical protein